MNEHETMKIHEMFYNLDFSGDGRRGGGNRIILQEMKKEKLISGILKRKIMIL